MTPTQAENIQSTERQYRTLRHVPPGVEAFSIHANKQGAFDPQTDEATIVAEVTKAMAGIYYALRVATPNHRPTVYVPSVAVLERVKSRLSPADLDRLILDVGS